ncbi:pyruvate, water dikinase regulatory protein [Aquisalimonas lutea]|uniref:posphoenolpyruvate synthetase regulatory kinase/phosphorylase PpsR n=1 Tax=Aquisalimonas lutea TaxID=1327750 RepID=UPI0025B2B0BC|nr:pyruvate, water dikinase regulatory protein [Aquisalimonas lutea]MDN3518341.1 pyruvate, water dikinase regulatory protein [Aquisalimonas lutea]
MSEMRTVFFISDRTGITAETLGHSLLTQFDVELEQVTLPFVDDVNRAQRAVEQINQVATESGARPIVFSTVVKTEVRDHLRQCHATFFDFFETFVSPLERELGVPSSHAIGQAHGRGDDRLYDVRIDAMNFALNNDDGASTRHYSDADVIIVGVSRTGKTPVSIYLALQYGIYAANYPLTDEDLLSGRLPAALRPYRKKLYGFSIQAERLREIRHERRPNSHYASLQQCQMEVARAEGLFRRESIPFVKTTSISIEEIATTMILDIGLKRRLY